MGINQVNEIQTLRIQWQSEGMCACAHTFMRMRCVSTQTTNYTIAFPSAFECCTFWHCLWSGICFPFSPPFHQTIAPNPPIFRDHFAKFLVNPNGYWTIAIQRRFVREANRQLNFIAKYVLLELIFAPFVFKCLLLFICFHELVDRWTISSSAPTILSSSNTRTK